MTTIVPAEPPVIDEYRGLKSTLILGTISVVPGIAVYYFTGSLVWSSGISLSIFSGILYVASGFSYFT